MGNRACIVLSLAAMLQLLSCGQQPDPVLPPQPWIAQDPWPTIVLTNRIRLGPMEFHDKGGAFLIDASTDMLAAAPKHFLLGLQSSDIQAVHFAGLLHSWTMYPRSNPTDSVVVGRLLNEDPQEKLIRQYVVNRDWLVFSIGVKPPGIQPLQPRFGQLAKDQPVYLIGWSENGDQSIFAGVVYERYPYKYLVDFGEQDVVRFSGAPVIDAGGYLIGIHTGKIGAMSWVNSTCYLKEILDRR